MVNASNHITIQKMADDIEAQLSKASFSSEPKQVLVLVKQLKAVRKILENMK